MAKEKKLKIEFEEINSDVEYALKKLEEKEKVYDSVSLIARDIIRKSGIIITKIHNNKFDDIEKELPELVSMVKNLQKIENRFGYYTMQSYQEYAEAYILYNIKKNDKFITLKELNIPAESYLSGMMDVVGELKREIIELLREKDIKKAEHFFDYMKVIYDKTRSIRYPEVILPGFRKKQDVARIQIESAGNEIVFFIK